MSDRIEKVNELLRRAVAQAIREVIGTAAGMITVTQVETSADLRAAKVWVSVVSREPELSIRLLEEHRAQIQREINPVLTMKYTPRVEFLLDTSGEYVERMERLFRELEE
jgi:ribosome-binding factor A